MIEERGEKTHRMLLALYVLTGVLTEHQLGKLIEDDTPVPQSWQEIVKYIESITKKG